MEYPSDDAFYEALNNEDHLGMVVRGHIHIEHWIDAFLSRAMPLYSKYEKSIGADYETKVLLCCALGLSPDLKTPLAHIGTLRNRFAHRLGYKLTSSDVSDIYASLSGSHKAQIKSAYKQMAERFERTEKSFAALSSVERLSLLFMFLRAKLKMANSQLSSRA